MVADPTDSTGGEANAIAASAQPGANLTDEQLAGMSPKEIVAVPAMDQSWYWDRCRRNGRAWFERTEAAKNPPFSIWVGEVCGWPTRAGAEALSHERRSLMGRMSLRMRARSRSPFARLAREVIRGRRPQAPPLLAGRRFGDGRCGRGGRRRPGVRGSSRTTRAGPGDESGDDAPAGWAKARRQIPRRPVA
jgi:hypothetical protein